MKEGMITLSQDQLKTFTVINRFIDKSVSRQQAAELLCESCGSSFLLDRVRNMDSCPVCGEALWGEDSETAD